MQLAPHSPPAKDPRQAQYLVGFFALFVGLCTILALVVTVGEAWQEHRQQSWPSATATVRSCKVEPYLSRRPHILHIVCRIDYFADGEQRQSRVRSSTSPQAMQIEAMNAWAERHVQGSSLEIHYDPAHPGHAVLVSTDMPGGGPHTPNNMKLLMAGLFLFVVLATITTLLGPKKGKVNPPAGS